MDYAVVLDWILQQIQRWDVQALAFDRWGIAELILRLDEHNVPYTYAVDDREIVEGRMLLLDHPQGFMIPHRKGYEMRPAMPRSIAHAEEAILTITLKVKRNLALRSAVLGTVPVVDASLNRRFMKNKALTAIDACVALVMAVGIAIDARDQQKGELSTEEVVW